MSHLLCPPMQFYELCCLQSALLITYIVVSETSNTTHPVTQCLDPEDWVDKCIGAHILWRPYTRYNVCESRHGECYGVAIQFKSFGSNNLIHFCVMSRGKGVAEIGLRQAKRHECTILLLRQNKLVCILGCWNSAWEVADWTVIRKWKWLFLNGYKC
jgi:hypothetical protein